MPDAAEYHRRGQLWNTAQSTADHAPDTLRALVFMVHGAPGLADHIAAPDEGYTREDLMTRVKDDPPDGFEDRLRLLRALFGLEGDEHES